MIRQGFNTAFFAIAFLIILGASSQADRIRMASLNVCTDQLLVLLADPEQVVSVTFLAADPKWSFVADRVDRISKNHGSAEEIFSTSADFVLAVGPAARPAVDVLKKLGVNIIELPLAVSFAEIRSQVHRLASLLNQEERGRILISEMDRHLGQVSPVNERSPIALVIGPNGFTSGSDSLVADVLGHAGYRNAAALSNIRGFGRLSLEQLALIEPDVVIVDSSAVGASSLSSEFLKHPVLVRKQQQVSTISIDSALWVCGGPYTALAVKLLTDHKQ